MTSFSDRLKELRKAKGLKQTDMANLLKITPRHYQQYEYGKVDPPTSTTIFLADYFGVSVDYLVGRENYWTNSDGDITVKVPADIFNLDTDALKKKLGRD